MVSANGPAVSTTQERPDILVHVGEMVLIAAESTNKKTNIARVPVPVLFIFILSCRFICFNRP